MKDFFFDLFLHEVKRGKTMFEMTAKEKFYKKYAKAKEKGERAVSALLASYPEGFFKEDFYVIPELMDTNITMYPESAYFPKKNGHESVRVMRHDRYQPAFDHAHESFEIAYVLKGSCLEWIMGEKHEFKEGDFWILSPKTMHRMYIDNDEGVVLTCIIKKKTFEDVFSEMLRRDNILTEFFLSGIYSGAANAYIIFPTGEDALVSENICHLYVEGVEKKEYFEEIQTTLFISTMMYIMREYGKTAIMPDFRSKNDVTDYAMIRYIKEHFSTVTLSEVADRFHYSSGYVSRLIPRLTGMTFKEIQQKLRMEKAGNLLAHTDLSVAEVSEQVGYINTETFIRAFKKTFGQVPSTYRR